MRMNKNKAIVPKLRFPEFSNSYWGITRLNTLADKITKRNKDDNIGKVFTNSATEGVVDQEEYFDRGIANKHNLTNYFVVEKGDYVYNPRISNTAPVGPISKNKLGIGVMSPLYTIFRFRNKENDFYEHFFHTNLWHAYIKSLSNTGARHDRITISVDDFMKMPLPYTSPGEQQKIADCLFSIDELIDAESRKLKVLEKYKKGLIQKLFPEKGKTIPEWRFPEFRGYEEWKLQKLKQVCDFQEGYAFSSNNFEVNNTDSNHIQVVRITDINNKNSNADKVFVNMDLIRNNDLYRYLISKNDLVLSLTGAAGFNFFMWDTNIAVLNQRTLKIIPKNEKNHAIKFLIEPLIYKEINMHGTGQNNNLSKEVLKNVEIVLPISYKEQQKIADCLSEIDIMITEQSNKVKQLKAHKKGLMQGLFPSFEEADV